MNDLDKLRELKQLDTIILKYLDDYFSNNNIEWVDDIEKVGLTVVEYKNTIYNSLKEIIDKYKDDFYNKTIYIVIDSPKNESWYGKDELESETFSLIIEKFKMKYNVDDEFCEIESDWMKGDCLIFNLLYYFRLFYEKWYLQSKINSVIDELFKVEL